MQRDILLLTRFHLDTLLKRQEPLSVLALKSVDIQLHLNTLQERVDQLYKEFRQCRQGHMTFIQHIKETWMGKGKERVLSLGPTFPTYEFLRLLATGVPGPEFNTFLVNQVGEQVGIIHG